MTTIVIDASIAAGALFRGQRDHRVGELLQRPGVDLAAPELLRYEIANAAYRLLRRGLLDREDAARAFDILAPLDIRWANASGYAERAFDVAADHGQRATYDAIYLACAEDLGADLWTRDRRFITSFSSQRPPFLRLFPDDLHVLE